MDANWSRSTGDSQATWQASRRAEMFPATRLVPTAPKYSTVERIVFQTLDGKSYPVACEQIASLSFMNDGDVFIYYTAGDCDVMAPYVDL